MRLTPLEKQQKHGRLWVLVPAYGWLLLFFIVPFLLVLCISFSEAVDAVPPYKLFFGFDAEGNFQFSPVLSNYRLLFTDYLYLHTYFVSIWLAAISTVMALLIAYPIAYGIVRAPRQYRNILLLLVVIPFWTGLLLRVYAWIVILKSNGLLNNWLINLGLISQPLAIMNTQIAVVIGIVYSYLPFMILPLYSALEKLPPAYLEAAEDLGAKPLAAFWQVTLPLSVSGIVAGCMMVFIPALGEFVIPDLLGGSNVLTIGKVLWNEFFNNRDWPTAAAVTIIMTMMLVVPIMIVQRIIGRREVRR